MRLRSLAPLAIVPLFLIAAPITGCEQDPAPTDLSETAADAHEEIFGGAVDTADNYRAVVWVYDEDQGVSCSGTIIASNGSTAYVLTAGHCAVDENGNAIGMDYVAIAENYDDCFSNPYGPLCEAVFAVVPGSQQVHPSYNPAAPQDGYDFSLLRISGASGVPVIPAASSPDGLTNGAQVTQVGFGVTQSNNMNSQRRFVSVDVDALYSNFIFHNQTDGKGTCSGDSGGPTLFNGKVVGVTSFGDQNCQTDGYSGRVQAVYNGFIAPYINAPVTETCDTCFADEVNQPAGQCYSTVDACYADTACKGLIDCLNACGANDQTCVNNCASQYQAGIAKYNAIFDCFCNVCASLCTAECSTSTGSTGASTGSGLTTSNGAGGGSGSGGAAGTGGSSSASGDGDSADGGETGGIGNQCNCATPGAPAGSPFAAIGLGAIGLAIAALRRKR